MSANVLAPQHEVAQQLAGRRALQEAVAGEAGGVEEAADVVGLADDRVVVRAHVVQAGPAARMPVVGDPRRAVLGGDVEQRGDPVVGRLDVEARASRSGPTCRTAARGPRRGSRRSRRSRSSAGCAAGGSSIGSVKSTWRRSRETGSSTPTSSPQRRDQAPAAQITVSVRTLMSPAWTASIRSSRSLDPVDRAARLQVRAERARGERVAARRRPPASRGRPAASSSRRARRRLRAAGQISCASAARDHLGRDAELVLQRDAARERVDVGLAGEQEQVADLVQVDLPARAAAERP